MSHQFISTLTKIVKELGGTHFFPNSDIFHDLTIVFRKDNLEIFDHVKFKITPAEIDCGISLKSKLTLGKYVPLKVYVYHLVEYMEEEFCTTILLPPTTARFYFRGEIEYKNYPLKN